MRILLSLAALALPCAAAADTVTLANGRALTGKAEEGEKAVRIRLHHGWVEFPKAEVVKVDKGPTPWELYEGKAAEAKDGAGHLALAAWCRSQNLPDEARQEWEKALAADPECAEARVALGFRKVNGAWAIPEEPKEEKKAEKPAAEDAEAARPVERWSNPLSPGTYPSRSSYDPSYYPASPWIYTGTAYGWPLGWASYPAPVFSSSSCTSSCSGFGIGLRYSTSFAEGRGRLFITLGQ